MPVFENRPEDQHERDAPKAHDNNDLWCYVFNGVHSSFNKDTISLSNASVTISP
jgi:hypothetical protein